jgi:hypothetical protein
LRKAKWRFEALTFFREPYEWRWHYLFVVQRPRREHGNIGNEDKVMRKGKAALFSVKIDNDGKMVKKLLYERHTEKFFLCPVFSSQIITMHGREYLFGKAIL